MTANSSIPSSPSASHTDIVYPAAVPFILIHLGCFGALWTGVTWKAAALGFGLYWLRIFGIGAGYHRYFSHRAFATSRLFQFLLAWLAQSSAQSSVIWWAARHREHHLHADTEQDVHSPRHRGFFYAHMGWVFDRRHGAIDLSRVEDLDRLPELRWLRRLEHAPAALLALTCFLLAGWSGLVVGFLWSTVAVYHATFCINSLAHTHGRQRYVTGDTSRNNALLALMTMGEGWHNNHHAFQSSVRQGFRPWEVDLTYLLLRGLDALGIVWDLRAPPEAVLRNEHRLGTRVIRRAGDQLAWSFDPQHIARTLVAALNGRELTELRARLAQAVETVAHPPLPHLPTREELASKARAMFARTASLDAIIDHAHATICAAVAASLSSVQGEPASR